MKKLDVLEHRNQIINKILDANINSIRHFELNSKINIEQKSYSNSLFDKIDLIYKSDLFDTEMKLFNKTKLILSNELVKIKYSFEYHKEKDKLSVYIYECGVKKNYKTNNFYYFKSKYHVLCIKSDGKLYVINNLNKKPVLSNLKIYNHHSNKFKLFNYLSGASIVRISNEINTTTSYFYNHTKYSYEINTVVKYNDILNANNIDELHDNTVKKVFSKEVIDLLDSKNVLLYLYYKLDSRSIDYINKNYKSFNINTDVGFTESYLYHIIKSIHPNIDDESLILISKLTRSNRKLNIIDFKNSINKINRSCNKKDITYIINKFTEKPYKFKLLKNELNYIKKYLVINDHTIKVTNKSNDKELIDFLKNSSLDCTFKRYNSNCNLFIKVYNNKKLVDIIYGTPGFFFYSWKNILYRLEKTNYNMLYQNNIFNTFGVICFVVYDKTKNDELL